MQKDGYLVKHLLDHNLIDRRTYESIVNPVPPQAMPGSQGRHSRGRHSHRRLPQVEEEEVIAGSSRRHQQRSEHLSESPRDDGIHKHKHRSEHNWHSLAEAQRNRYLGGLIAAPAVVYPDDAVPKPLERPASSTYSSTKMSESIDFQSSTVSSRNAPSKHDEHQSVGRAGDGTATNTVNHDLYKVDPGLMGEGNSDSPSRVESSQSQDPSNIAPSSCSTDASVPESGSFVLAEQSEEEDKKVDDNHPFIQFRCLAVMRVLEAFRSWRGRHSQQEMPCDGVDESDPAPNDSKGKGKDPQTGKRKSADRSESNTNRNNSSGPSLNQIGCSKRRRTANRQLTFACPYTKKDPMLYRDCYKYKLSRIRDVKQHLDRCHRYPLYCPRCMGTFQTENERDEHIREFSCPSRPWIKLDGITESQGRQLSKKSASNSSPEAQWFVVFDIVFPGHKPRPQSPYTDSELLQDITLYQGFLTDYGPQILSELLIERGLVTSSLPDEERDLAASLRAVLAEGLRAIFDQWVARSSIQDSNVSSGPGSIGQNTSSSSSSSRERASSNSVHDSRAVPSESSGSRPGGGPVDAPLDSEDAHGASSGQTPLSEGLDGLFNLEHGTSEFLSEYTYNGPDDELRRFFTDA